MKAMQQRQRIRTDLLDAKRDEHLAERHKDDKQKEIVQSDARGVEFGKKVKTADNLQSAAKKETSFQNNAGNTAASAVAQSAADEAEEKLEGLKKHLREEGATSISLDSSHKQATESLVAAENLFNKVEGLFKVSDHQATAAAVAATHAEAARQKLEKAKKAAKDKVQSANDIKDQAEAWAKHTEQEEQQAEQQLSASATADKVAKKHLQQARAEGRAAASEAKTAEAEAAADQFELAKAEKLHAKKAAAQRAAQQHYQNADDNYNSAVKANGQGIQSTPDAEADVKRMASAPVDTPVAPENADASGLEYDSRAEAHLSKLDDCPGGDCTPTR